MYFSSSHIFLWPHVGQPNDRFPARNSRVCTRTFYPRWIWHSSVYLCIRTRAMLVPDKFKYFTGYESISAGKMFARRLEAAFQYIARRFSLHVETSHGAVSSFPCLILPYRASAHFKSISRLVIYIPSFPPPFWLQKRQESFDTMIGLNEYVSAASSVSLNEIMYSQKAFKVWRKVERLFPWILILNG